MVHHFYYSACNEFGFTIILSTGSYLGYENKLKYRVWIPHSLQEIKHLECTTTDYKSLANKLFQLVCKTELNECPDSDVCCTYSDGENLIDQEKLRGIRCKYYYSAVL